MKKFMFFIVVLALFFPLGVNADTLYTKITGNQKIRPGANIVYTVIIDHKLTSYEAILNYDRSVLNLVSIDELNIDTSLKKFVVDRGDSVKINVDSDSDTLVAYTITFNAKHLIKVENTEINIETIKAKSSNEEFQAKESYFKIDFVEEDTLFVDDEEKNVNDEGIFSDLLNDVKSILKNYANPITYGSIALNIILVVVLISTVRRKRVDYDF